MSDAYYELKIQGKTVNQIDKKTFDSIINSIKQASDDRERIVCITDLFDGDTDALIRQASDIPLDE